MRRGIIFDTDGLVLREISLDERLSVWSQKREEAMTILAENATDIIMKFGGTFREV